MPTLTLAVPKELKSEMDSLPELNWSEIARRAISKEIKEYKLFKSIVSKSKLTEKDALEIVQKRYDENKILYKKLYNFNFGEDLSVFDKVISTDGLNAQQVLDIAKKIVRELL